MLEDLIKEVRLAEGEAENIVADARAKARDIISNAVASSEEFIENAKHDAKALITKKTKEAANLATENAAKLLAEADAAASQAVLAAKKNINNAVDIIVNSVLEV